MKVMFVMCKDSTDHLGSCLWDGLCEVCGERNVVDAVGHRLLHASDCGEKPYTGDEADRFGTRDVLSSISGRREECRVGIAQPGNWDTTYDLLVLNAAFLREYDWEWARKLTQHLKPGAKIAYIEGWDAAWEVHPPEMHVDAVFRKEIDPGYDYNTPYGGLPVHHLTFAAPARWFHPSDETNHRDIDVFYSGTTHSQADRWATIGAAFQTRRCHQSVIATKHMGVSVADYFGFYRRSKLALCPASAERADSLRTYEAVACGCIPLFIGYPPWQRDKWFSGKVFECGTPGEVAAHIEAALDRDLPAMRRELLAWAREHHTTRARAETLLKAVGML